MENSNGNKIIYLTFDDGPNEPYTSRVLDILAEHGAKATFFVCGQNIIRSPESLKRIASGEHAIGIHSYSHSLLKTLAGKLMAEIAYTRDLIQKYAGRDTLLYRSPWGITMPWLKKKILAEGFFIFHWDIMAFDWRQPRPELIAGRVIGQAFSGAVVLLHDGCQVKNCSRQNTVEALPVILKQLTQQGYSFKILNPVK